VKGLTGDIVSITAGEEFTCAMNATNSVYCWGNNASGQLNDGTTIDHSSPTEADLMGEIVMMSGGQQEIQGINSDGTVQLWNNQLVIPVTGLTANNNVFVSADRFHEGGCALTANGNVKCWGAITNPKVEDALVGPLMASGGAHACALRDGGLVCWGNNSNGQLGDGSTVNHDAPVDVTGLKGDVIALATGEKHTCVVLDDNSISCWGLNTSGQLGNGTTAESHVPVLVLFGK